MVQAKHTLYRIIFILFHCIIIFQDFPWTLMNCSSEKEFYLKWKHSVVPVLLYRNNMNLFEEITNKLQISSSDLIKVILIVIFNLH